MNTLYRTSFFSLSLSQKDEKAGKTGYPPAESAAAVPREFFRESFSKDLFGLNSSSRKAAEQIISHQLAIWKTPKPGKLSCRFSRSIHAALLLAVQSSRIESREAWRSFPQAGLGSQAIGQKPGLWHWPCSEAVSK